MSDRLRTACQFLVMATIIIATTTAAGGLSTSDLAREKRWAEQTVDDIFTGEPLWLVNPNNHTKFLAVYTKPPTISKKAVILLHGLGVHPTWGFINKLRVDLAEAGWHTLSIQLPVRPAGAKAESYIKTFPEAFQRIDVAIGFLKKKGITEIHLIGHSLGAMTAIGYLGQHPKAPIYSVVAIGAGNVPSKHRYTSPHKSLKYIRQPVLDIFGGQDFEDIRRDAPRRLQSAKQAGNQDYHQTRVPGADHFFTDHYAALKKNLIAWLRRH